MHIDMLWVGSRWVTLILPAVRSSCMSNYQAWGGLFSSIRDDNCSSPFPIVSYNFAIVVPEHKRGVQVKWSSMNNASQIYGWSFFYIALLRSKNPCVGLDDSQVHPVLKMRRGWNLTTIPALICQGYWLQHKAPFICPSIVMDLKERTVIEYV